MPYIFLVCLLSRYLFLFVVLSTFPFSVLGLSVPLVRVFSLVASTFPVLFPLFPATLFLLFLLRSHVFLPLFSSSFLSFFFHLEKSSLLNRA